MIWDKCAFAETGTCYLLYLIEVLKNMQMYVAPPGVMQIFLCMNRVHLIVIDNECKGDELYYSPTYCVYPDISVLNSKSAISEATFY